MVGIKQSDMLIIKCNVQNEMQCYVKMLVQKAMKRYEEEREVATYIKVRFDSHYQEYWQCIVGKHFDCWKLVCSLPQKAIADGIQSMGVENATLALPILDFTSASEPSCSSMMLPRYVKDSTSNRVSPLRVIGLLFSLLHLRTMVFPLCMLMFTDAETAATLAVFICICSCVGDRRAKPSAKSKSSN
ncbi:unnamed protein product [Schistosoma curassoni]|uniref:Dynein light chain n=1 Tax=Schistosoma curassoni TaxID=6186 RepID=A0A183L0W6_9TREM|nr:unnamed protein product [Schistosoma curassoni]